MFIVIFVILHLLLHVLVLDLSLHHLLLPVPLRVVELASVGLEVPLLNFFAFLSRFYSQEFAHNCLFL